MKRLSTLFLLLYIFSLFGFQQLTAQKDSITVGLILANTFTDRWLKDRDYFVEEFKQLGGKTIVIDCYDQVENQISAAKDLVKKQVDGIAIVSIDAVASGGAVQVAKDAEIPVLAYDRMILNAPIDYYVSFNSITAGEQMATNAINKVKEGNILYLGGPSEDYNSILLRQGVFNILDPLKEKYNINSIQASTWNQLDAYLIFQDFLSNGNLMPHAVICGADVLARGVVDVLIENDVLGNVIVTGQDAELDICKMIIRGEVDMTIYKPIEKLAEEAANMMWKMINGEKIEATNTVNNKLKDVPSRLLTPVIVTKGNIEETIIKDSYYTKEQIFGQ